jgi:hypothetical protein
VVSDGGVIQCFSFGSRGEVIDKALSKDKTEASSSSWLYMKEA